MKDWNLIENLNAISTASIPVIKATVDLNKLRETEMSDVNKDIEQASNTNKDFGSTQTDASQEERELQKKQQQERNKEKIPEHLAKLKIDITFDDNCDPQNDDTDLMIDKINSAPSMGHMYGGFDAGNTMSFMGP